MSWYNDTLTKYGKEIKQSTIASFVLSLVFLIYTYSAGHTFSWQEINPIEQPTIFARYFYSAFTFVTIGAFLYYVVKLWKGLHFILVKVLGSWELYNGIKAIVWLGLVAVTYFYIVPAIVGIMNAVLSFFYNIFNLILYLSSTLGVFLILSIGGAYLIKRFKLSPVVVKNETPKQ